MNPPDANSNYLRNGRIAAELYTYLRRCSSTRTQVFEVARNADDGQTVNQSDRQTARRTNGRMDKQTPTHIDNQIHKCTDAQTTARTHKQFIDEWRRQNKRTDGKQRTRQLRNIQGGQTKTQMTNRYLHMYIQRDKSISLSVQKHGETDKHRCLIRDKDIEPTTTRRTTTFW